jgi:hypothetical protein
MSCMQNKCIKLTQKGKTSDVLVECLQHELCSTSAYNASLALYVILIQISGQLTNTVIPFHRISLPVFNGQFSLKYVHIIFFRF